MLCHKVNLEAERLELTLLKAELHDEAEEGLYTPGKDRTTGMKVES